ncbi:hypothetical protein Lfu02_80170 [Longispora fulva]|uniref:Uncharacterized protein n=1 Tax=Longispora fulva TaxID=619741 RepID=A0A8J7KZB8_9ACTN|nr:hypothetical protein [Longispora fulva]MBG6140687.1 hypothetical protein [Longispora fulva]GIG63645.1 hypothetical protein Lfu02_80170 [Longispora fulva]
MLVSALGPTSRLAVALRGSEHDGWGLAEHLLASLVDATQATTHAVIQVNSRKRVRPPAPLPRPGARPTRRVVRVADLPGARPVFT